MIAPSEALKLLRGNQYSCPDAARGQRPIGNQVVQRTLADGEKLCRFLTAYKQLLICSNRNFSSVRRSGLKDGIHQNLLYCSNEQSVPWDRFVGHPTVNIRLGQID